MNKYIPKIYGISQNPSTNDYILVCQNKHYSGNEIIDVLIQEMQLKASSYNDSTVFEWIPYHQFDNLELISKGDYATIHSATWKNGPLHCNLYQNKYIRESNKKVTLKCIFNSRNIIDQLLEEVQIFQFNLLF